MNVIHFDTDRETNFEPTDFDTSALPDAYDTLELGSRTLDVRGIDSVGGIGDGGYADDPTMRMIDAWLRATEPASA